MKKVIILIIVLVVALLFAFSYQTSTRDGEIISQKVWRGWQGEAAKSDYYVIKQVLARNGMTLTIHHNDAAPILFDAYDAIIFSPNSVILDEHFGAELNDWVTRGGRLLLPAEHPLAADYKVSLEPIVAASEKPCEQPNQFRWKTRSNTLLTPQTALPGRIVLAKKKKVRVGVACEGQLVVAMQSVSKGKVIVFAHDLSLWSDVASFVYQGMPEASTHIPVAMGDNAAYLHDLLGTSKRVLLVRHPIKRPAQAFNWTLPEAKWWPLLAILALTLLALLWTFGSRFGPLIAVSSSRRTDIDHHLHAAGRFWEQESGYMWLAKASQQRFATDFAVLARRFGSEEAAIAWLVSQTHLSAQQIKHGLDPAAIPKNEFAFVKFMSTLEELRRAL